MTATHATETIRQDRSLPTTVRWTLFRTPSSAISLFHSPKGLGDLGDSLESTGEERGKGGLLVNVRNMVRRMKNWLENPILLSHPQTHLQRIIKLL